MKQEQKQARATEDISVFPDRNRKLGEARNLQAQRKFARIQRVCSRYNVR